MSPGTRPLRLLLLVPFFASTGCVIGYRGVSAQDDRLSDVAYAGLLVRPPMEDAPVRIVGEARIGVQSTARVPSATILGGTDQWAGVTFEGAVAGQVPVWRQDGHELWAEAALQTGVLRTAHHLSGPTGSHDHGSDRHNVHLLGMVGGTVRFGYGTELWTSPYRRGLGLDLGVGVMQVAARGMEYFVELRLLVLQW